jgi:hypothetical protein
VAEHSNGKIFTQYGVPGRRFEDLQKFSDDGVLEKLHLIRLIPSRENEFDPAMRPCFTVDFKTGIFTVNGEVKDERPEGVDLTGAKFRPIYYRRIKGGMSINKGPWYAPMVKYYWIGWQTIVNSKNYQRMIQYDVPNNTPVFVRKR